MVEFKEAMDSMVSALAAGYSMENAITEAYRDMKLLHSEDTRMMRELWDIQQKISLHQPLDEVLSAFASKVVWKILSLSHKFMRRQEKKRREFGKSDEADGTEYQREDGDTERNSNDDCRKKKMEANCMTAIPFYYPVFADLFSRFLDPLYEGFFGRLFMTGAFLCIWVPQHGADT